MKQYWKISLFICALCCISPLSALSIGVLSGHRCLEQSEVGKKEQQKFEQLRKQLEQGIENKEKELNELRPKLEGDYLDTLTPEAEQQLKERVQRLQQELQELYYNMSMMLNKAQYDLMQRMMELIRKASKVVAGAKKLDMVANDDAFFYSSDTLDVTDDVMKELNKAS